MKMRSTAKFDPSVLRDLRRDWQGWNRWERRTAAALAVTSALFAAVWLAQSLRL